MCLDGQLGEPLDLFAFSVKFLKFQHMCIDGQLVELFDLIAQSVCGCMLFMV